MTTTVTVPMEYASDPCVPIKMFFKEPSQQTLLMQWFFGRGVIEEMLNRELRISSNLGSLPSFFGNLKSHKMI